MAVFFALALKKPEEEEEEDEMSLELEAEEYGDGGEGSGEDGGGPACFSETEGVDLGQRGTENVVPGPGQRSPCC